MERPPLSRSQLLGVAVRVFPDPGWIRGDGSGGWGRGVAGGGLGGLKATTLLDCGLKVEDLGRLLQIRCSSSSGASPGRFPFIVLKVLLLGADG